MTRRSHGLLHLTLAGVLAESSNIGTILASEKVGVDRLYAYLQAFGLGQPSGLNFPGESPGILDPLRNWSATQQYTVPFGQGLAVNALQVATVYSTIANGGVRVEPSSGQGLLATRRFGQGSDRTDADAGRQRNRRPRRSRACSKLSPLTRAPHLRLASRATGSPERRAPPQRVDPTCGCYRGYTASFVGFAPADNPQLVVLVVLDNPINGHYGGSIAAPVFKDVMSFALESEKIPPTGTTPPVVKLSLP